MTATRLALLLSIILSVASYQTTPISIPNLTYYPPAIRPAGDLNGDGFDDFMVSKPSSNMLTVYFGSIAGVNVSATFDLTMVTPRTTVVGDFSNDTQPDALMTLVPDIFTAYVFDMNAPVTASTFPNISYTLTENSTNYGTDAVALDFNVDGVMDVVIGAELASVHEYQEGALIFHEGINGVGLSQTASGRIYSYSLGAQFARSLAAGDVNGDHIEDIIVGFANYSVASDRLEEGAVVVYFGGSPFDYGQSGLIINSETPNEHLGLLVAAGDVNGDGLCDIVATSSSQFWVLVSNGTAFTKIPFAIPAIAVASGKDISGDGIDDFLVATLNTLYIYHGDNISIASTPFTFPLQNSNFHPLNFIGDIDGDSVEDFAVLDPPSLVMLVFTKYGAVSPSPTPSRKPSSSPSTTPSSGLTPSTTPSPSPSDSASGGASSGNINTTAAAAGSAAGGSTCLIIVVAGIFWIRKKKKKDADSSTSEEEDVQMEKVTE